MCSYLWIDGQRDTAVVFLCFAEQGFAVISPIPFSHVLPAPPPSPTHPPTHRIAKLSKELEQVNHEHSMLTSQVKKTEDDLARARRRQADLKKEQEALDSQIGQLQLESEETTRAVRTALKEKEDKLVANDLMKVEVSRLRTLLGSKADEVFSLENKKVQLQLSMEERKQEVAAHQESLTAQHRCGSIWKRNK